MKHLIALALMILLINFFIGPSGHVRTGRARGICRRSRAISSDPL
jgi:hypothetical protein